MKRAFWSELRRGCVGLALLAAACAAPVSTPPASTGSSKLVPVPPSAPPSTEASVSLAERPSDGMYVPPDPLPAGPPGAVLRSEPLAAPDGTRAFAVLYLSTARGGRATAVSAIVLSPGDSAPAGGRPVVSWAHGSRGVSDACAPSREGAADLLPIARPFLDLGYVFVASDYEGLGTPGPHPFFDGPSEGRSVLDAGRAARMLEETGAGDRVAVLGHSQGGHAALWAAELAPTYAPELSIVGTVAAAPPIDLQAFATSLRREGAPGIDRLIGLQITSTWHTIYGLPVDELLSDRDQARAAALPDACPDLSLTPDTQPLMRDPGKIPAWRDQLKANTPGQSTAQSAILILHGTADDIVPVAIARSGADRLCAAGDTVELRIRDGADHGVLFGDGELGQVAKWLADQFAGRGPTRICTS